MAGNKETDMSTAKQADTKPGINRSAKTDTASRAQKDDPAERANVQDGRLPKAQSGRPERMGQGVDETGMDSRAPHSKK